MTPDWLVGLAICLGCSVLFFMLVGALSRKNKERRQQLNAASREWQTEARVYATPNLSQPAKKGLRASQQRWF